MDQVRNISAMTRFFDHFAAWEEAVVQEKGISVAQMHLLEILGSSGSLQMKDLARVLGVQNGTLTVMAHRLETRGLIQRTRHQTDGRIQFLSLSDSGLELYREHHGYHARLVEQLEASLGPGDSEQFFRLMDRAGAILGGDES